MATVKFAEHFTNLLVSAGYTHCFLVPGGASMHLIDAARARLTCIPCVNESSAVVAAEYFNQISPDGQALALVTAGPGLTNAVTGIAGAYLESRHVLVVGGQVKSADLASGQLRQRGIQEVDGVAIVSPVCVAAERIERPVPDEQIVELLRQGRSDRRGPVFVEICLDAQATLVNSVLTADVRAIDGPSRDMVVAADRSAQSVIDAIASSSRPVVLVGGGIDPEMAEQLREGPATSGPPLMTTWNGFDRVADDHPRFAGRPNTWGQRSANILLSQADLVVALGTRLGIQQTGFNWREWTQATVIQVEVDPSELEKGHPRVDVPILADANRVLAAIASHEFTIDSRWIEHCGKVRRTVPLLDPENSEAPQFVSPYVLVDELSRLMSESDVLVPASSGSGQFVPMEVFRSKRGQRVVTNKGLASMGYGLAGAIGAAVARTNGRTVLVEGDGSFSQNFPELGTVVRQGLNLKIFLLDNDGYASIRTTQRNYFGGAYVGCDSSTGLGFPSWTALAGAFEIPCMTVGPSDLASLGGTELWNSPTPAMFVVQVDPEQTYFPKVTSRITESGSMESNPIWEMSPSLPDGIKGLVAWLDGTADV